MTRGRTPNRLAGHTLAHEGSAHDDRGQRVGAWDSATGGPGRARCSCGVLSEVLPSAQQRKAWHRDHKAAVRDGWPR